MVDRVHYLVFESPVGELLVVGDSRAIHRISFHNGPSPQAIDGQWHLGGDLVDQAARQLEEYFSGKRKQFTVPVVPKGTVFQNRAWQALRDIPYGETRSYGEQARNIGRPAASRAVGAANGRNPIPIMIPCHRVVGANGKLTGYAGGLGIKKFLLELEESVLAGKKIAHQHGEGNIANHTCPK